MALLKFAARSAYNGATYEAGKTYEVEDYPLGYVNRWLKRGVAEVVEDAEEIFPDPRGDAGRPPVPKEEVAEDFFVEEEDPEEVEEEGDFDEVDEEEPEDDED